MNKDAAEEDLKELLLSILVRKVRYFIFRLESSLWFGKPNRFRSNNV